MVEYLEGEKFKEIEMKYKLQFRYAISNYGRMLSYTDKKKDGKILNGSLTDGYRLFKFKVKNKKKEIKSKHLFFYKLVAEYFLKGQSDKRPYVIHLDYDRSNDHVSNLKWVSQKEKMEHYSRSPFVREAAERQAERQRKSDGNKLTTKQVKVLKKMILNPKRKLTMKTIADQYGVAVKTLYRIKTGENWGHITV